MNSISIMLFDLSFDGQVYHARKSATERFRLSEALGNIQIKLMRLFGVWSWEDDSDWMRTGCAETQEPPSPMAATVVDEVDLSDVGHAKADDRVNYQVTNQVNYCVSRMLYKSRSETVWKVSERNTSLQINNADNSIDNANYPVVISRLVNAVRSGIAGAVALGSAYAVSMPQKADADLITTYIDSHTDVTVDKNPIQRTVYYNSPIVNFYDNDGNLISNTMTNNVVLLYIKNEPGVAIVPVGGLTLNSQNNSEFNGFLWSRDGPSYLRTGMLANETATNGLNTSSYWIAGIDLDQDSIIGEYTRNTSDGTWTIQFEPNEAMWYHGDPNAPENAYTFSLNGVPAHPGSGTGPVTIDSIDIYAPYTVPEPSTTVMISFATMSIMPVLTISNSAPATTIYVQRADNLFSTNWLNITNFLTGLTNWTDTTATGDWKSLFYRVAQ